MPAAQAVTDHVTPASSPSSIQMNTFAPLPPPKQQQSQIPKVSSAMDGNHFAKQSRLEQMRTDYQRKLMREKEQKLIELYEKNQRKALQKVQRPPQHPGHPPPGVNSAGSAQRTGAPAQRESSSSTIISQASYRTANSAGSNFHMKHNAGWDRSKPLAPLEHKQSADTQSGNYPPVPTKPLIPRHRGSARSVVSKASIKDHQNVYSQASAPVYGSHRNPDEDLGSGSSTDSTPPPNLAQLRNLQRQRINKQRQAKPDNNSEPLPPHSDKKLTEFQRWQVEQDRARAERLKRNRTQNGRTHSVGSDVDKENSTGANQELALQQRQLMDAIHQREAELLRIQQDRLREEVEEEEKRERARRKRVETAELERKRKMREEEGLQMQMEEEREQRERGRQMKEEEVQMTHVEQRKALERERMRQRAAEKQRTAAEKQQKNSEDSRQAMQQNARQSPSVDRRSSLDQSWDDQASAHSQMANVKRTQRQEGAVKQQPSPAAVISSMADDLQFYKEAAIQEDAHGNVGSMAACKICGRRFAMDRIRRHQAACGNAHKKRKVLDPTKMRTKGTEMEKYIKNGVVPKDPPRRNIDWRSKRNDFISAIRYAKKVSQVEKAGGKLADLPPPPVSENLDYVQCPHCSRRFNPSTAERHIPKCKNTRARPAPPRRR